MKIKNFIAYLLIGVSLTACNNGEIKQLNEKIDKLTKENIELKNSQLSLQIELDNYKLNPAKVLADIKQNYADKEIATLKKNLDFLKEYHPESAEFEQGQKIYDKLNKEREAEIKKQKLEAEKAEAARKAKMAPIERIMDKYGCNEEIADLILHHKVRIGMTAEQCRASWGRPNDVNRTSGSYGVHEQWCYGGHNYLYFEDGFLTTIQN